MDFTVEFLVALVCELDSWFNKNNIIHGWELTDDEKKWEVLCKEGFKTNTRWIQHNETRKWSKRNEFDLQITNLENYEV